MESAVTPEQQHTNKDFIALAKEFRDFAFIISHDLNAPLRAIIGFSEILTEQYGNLLDDEGKEYLSLIYHNGKRAQIMLDGLLQYSRLNTMAKPLHVADSNSIAKDCLIVLDGQIASSRAHVEIGPLPKVKVDAEQLMQLFLILLDNALKFHTPGTPPHIAITAEDKEIFYEFCIQDNGIGIESAYHERVFDLFRRLHREEDYPGIGMGLAMAKKIVERHGGAIHISSEPGQGSRVYFTLPASPPQR
jgi:light-regulated signal transduction histidine kinase (bacteriophytochrome)